MSEQVLHALEVRAIDEAAIRLVCVPYNQTTFKAGYASGERFLPGAFAKSVEKRARKVRLVSLHPELHPAAVSESFEDGPEGLVGTFRFYPTREGREARERALAGVYEGASVEFLPVKERRGPDGAREIVEAQLHRVALELDTAYDAPILAVRSAAPEAPPVSPYADWTPPPVEVIPNVMVGP